MAQLVTEDVILEDSRHKSLYEKWNKRIAVVEASKLGGAKMDLARKAALAKVLENTSHFIKYSLTEATQSSDIGQYKRAALDIVAAVVPNLIAYDLVSVQALDNRIGMINYIEYLYGNKKGSTQSGTAFATTLNLHAVDKDFTSRLVKGEAYSFSGTVSTTQLEWKPVLPKTVKVLVDDASDTNTGLYTDKNGDGNLWLDGAAAATADFKVAYTTGIVSYPTSFIAANDTVEFSYSYNNEFVAANDIPEISLKLTSLPLEAKARRLKAYYAFEANYELTKEYGHDAQQLLNATAAGEIMREIDAEICFDLYNNAGAGPELVWSKAQPIGVSLVDHYDSFVVKLEEGSAQIQQATRKVPANFAVLGTQAAVVARTVRGFTPSGVKSMVGPYFLGTVGNLRLYVQPEFDVNSFVLGYKGETLFDAGYVYAPYMPIMTTDMIQLEDMAGRKGWATMYATAMLNPNMYVRGKITA